VKQFGGNAIAAELLPAAAANNFLTDGVDNGDAVAQNWTESDLSALGPGQIGGIIVDPQGAVIAGAQVIVTNTQTGRSLSASSGGDGHWVVSGLEQGPVRVTISSPGFKASVQDFELVASKPARMGTTLEIGAVQETVNITANNIDLSVENRRIEELAKKTQAAQLNNLSQNVFNLQRRVAGLLPVAVDVPRSGKSYRFVRPLVLEEETRITFQYKSR
jgi:carboxypeptidase family protein